MKITRKLLCAALAICMVLSVLAMSGCRKKDSGDATTAPAPGGDAANSAYTISVKTIGGMAMGGIDVYVYQDNTLKDLVQYGKTDDKGNLSLSMPAASTYAFTLSGVPEGYDVKDSYAFNGKSAAVTLSSALVKDKSPSGASFQLGDIMYDFSVTTPDGKKITLSEVLKEKEMVLLNFWYTTCSACILEFPYMQTVYEQYSDDIEIIALNPMNTDADIKNFKEQYQLSFPMASCNAAWAAAFNVTGYPTSVVIDRYGTVSMIHVGALTSERPFLCMFDTFTAAEYKQSTYESIDQVVTNVKPTVQMPAADQIAELLSAKDLGITFRAEEEDEYSWPFVEAKKEGVSCIKASNQKIEDSYSILYADVALKKGQAIGFDYWVSSEATADILYVIVDNEDIYSIHGDNQTGWKTCYPWVALEDGTHEVALCYIKDSSTNVGDDTAYIKNMRIIDSKDIDADTFIPRQAATSKDGFEYTYAEVVLNREDGYYHVGSENGPLLLANLMSTTAFNEEKTVFDIVYDGDVMVNGTSYYDTMVDYFSFASNASLNGICTVNEELAGMLKTVASVAGFDGDENEWLKMCMYYQTYGPNSSHLVDPIKGLAPFCAYTATLGTNVESNYFYYDRIIIPRGLLAEFTPSTSGVYRITSRNESQEGVDGWIFDENHRELLVYELSERMFDEEGEVSMVYYMEAGKSYYIDIAFWDLYETGYIYYDIEYIGPTYDMFRQAAPGYFTYDSDATGDAMYYIISGGIDVILASDGYYYEDLGKDASGKQLYGNLIYADFVGISLFDTPIKDMIDKGGFDFSKTEYDQLALTYLKNNNNDEDATIAYLKDYWGADYDYYYDLYQMDDIFEGIFHGEGEDLTEQMRSYVSKMLNTNDERQGCVPVDEKLAGMLQLLMDKYTFEGVENSWIKLCYYYDHFGPNA